MRIFQSILIEKRKTALRNLKMRDTNDIMIVYHNRWTGFVKDKFILCLLVKSGMYMYVRMLFFFKVVKYIY